MERKLVDLKSNDGWYVIPGRKVSHYIKYHQWFDGWGGFCGLTSCYQKSQLEFPRPDTLHCELCTRRLVLANEQIRGELYTHLTKGQLMSSNKEYWLWHAWQKLNPDWRELGDKLLLEGR